MRENAAAFREKVAARAGHSCEYCQIPGQASFAAHELDHVISLKHGGETTGQSRLLLHSLQPPQVSDLSSLDPATGQLAPLFHPRRDHWHEHFEPRNGELVGLIPSGRANTYLLRLNHPQRVQERLIRFGWRWTRDSPA
jgi:hypothetical protein